MNKHLFCFGLGYVANALAKDLLNEGWRISGTHTDKAKIKENEYFLENDSHFDTKAFQDATHILISIPPSENGDLVYLRFIEDIQKLQHLKWVGYFSSTSVYGDHQGAWVTENSATTPDSSAGKHRLIAEQQWLSTNLPINILRLSGIYGPKRSIFDTIKAGKAVRIYKKDHYFSRIYLKDLVNILKEIINNPQTGEIFNIADNATSAQHEMVSYACNLIKAPIPKLTNFEEANLTQTMKNYYQSSKKVDNSKIKKLYNLKLDFPSYKEGLIDILKENER
jgi:nucleoside-diphosphate-sugar epimerase